MPRTEEQFGEIREQKKSLIMDTALELFAHEGYYPTSISQIAAKAGISKGLLYNYFKSKEDLITAIVGKGLERLTESLDPDHDGFLTDEEFEFHVNETFRTLEEHRDYWKLIFSVMMQPAVFKLIIAKYSALHLPLKTIVADYFRRKGMEDPETEAAHFHALLDGVFLNYVLAPGEFPIEKLRKLIIERYK